MTVKDTDPRAADSDEELLLAQEEIADLELPAGQAQDVLGGTSGRRTCRNRGLKDH